MITYELNIDGYEIIKTNNLGEVFEELPAAADLSIRFWDPERMDWTDENPYVVYGVKTMRHLKKAIYFADLPMGQCTCVIDATEV